MHKSVHRTLQLQLTTIPRKLAFNNFVAIKSAAETHVRTYFQMLQTKIAQQ